MRTLYLLLLFSGLSVAALAQESSCSDGVDNDGDGFIDCYDSDCGGNSICQGTYIGNDTDCQLPQPPGSDFAMELENESTDFIASTHGRFVIGDMGDSKDGKDGVPEIVTAHTTQKKIYILDGRTLKVKYSATSPYRIDRYDIAIGDVRGTGCASIFVAEVERIQGKCLSKDWRGRCTKYEYTINHYVSSWDCEANFLWRTQVYARPFTLALADFDHDGKAELYFRNQILDAATGQVHIAGSGDWSKIDGGPVAVDILADSECADCAGLELVAGGEIYAVNLNAPNVVDGGSLTLVKKFNDVPGLANKNKWNTKFLDLDNDQFVNSQTSIADFDLDGNLDVLMTGTSDGGKTTIFYWNVKKNTADVYRPDNNWKYGAGRLNLADIDGDSLMNVAFVTGSYLYALDENLDFMWRIGIDEETSGYTSTTVFDFNNDGASEIVYRDETYLYIIKGDGTFSPPINCKSLTSNDYPIVADVDADGSTEICVICQDDFGDTNFQGADEGVIRTYKSANEPWVSSRKVWNQHGYFNVNVNDDLTIPTIQQKHHLVFSKNVCGDGENRVLNSFLNQSAILNTDGCKTYPSADVSFVPNPNLLNVTPPTCPDQEFHVSITLRNTGSVDLNADLPITFYNGDPTQPGAVKLKTHIVSLSNFAQGDDLVVPDITVTGTGSTFELFAVLNDAGTTSPLSLPNSGIEECNLGNNIASTTVRPRPFALSTEHTDHVQCAAAPAPPNGSVKAFKDVGGVEQTVGFTFYWFDGTTAGTPGAADHTGSEINNLGAGTYTVYALHDLFQCGSDTTQVVVGQESIAIGATVNVDHAYTNCNDPDGALSVTPDVGDVNDYTYQWFEGTVFGTSPTLSNSSVLGSAEALTYSVLVTQKSSGCETLESGTVPNQTVSPVVSTSVVPANCVPANSGEASANVGGATAGYTFFWYDGSTSKPTADHTGATYPDITAGSYTVVARDNTTGCRSNETVVVVPTVSGISVTANITSQQTSCALPNGAASANVGNQTAGYSFRWFEGDNTINEIGTNFSITGLAAGDYTVQATSLATGCTDTELITIVDNILIPTVSPSVVAHQQSCLPADGAVNATAAGSPGGYNFYWFDGNIGTPDTTVANFEGATYSGLDNGFYTVVAVDANTRCQSLRGVVQVLDQTVNPVVSATPLGQTSCDPANPDGQASADVGGVTAGYKFRWFLGADTTTFLVQNPVLTNRAAGTYTVKAQSLTTGCSATEMVLINDISAKPTLSLTKQDNSICDAGIGFTGSVTASFATNPNAQPGHTYVYEWRRNGVLIPGEDEATLAGVDAGTYSVTVRNEVLNCVSDPASVVVGNAVDLPTPVTSSMPSTICDPSLTPDGSASVVSVDGVAVGSTTDFTYQWHVGNGTATPISVATNPTADDPVLMNVQGGATSMYTVLITNTLTGCQNTAVVNVADARELPELTLASTPNSVCDPALTDPHVEFNGTITTTIDNQVGTFADYDFELGGGTGVQDGAPNQNRFIQLNGGITYTVTVTHLPTGCVSTPASIQVLNDQQIPVIVTSADGSTNCVPGIEDGRARVVTVDGAAATTTGFTFAWTGPASFPVTTKPTNTAIELQDVQGGAGYNYTVLVTNQSNGCQNTAVVNVPDARELPELTLAMTPNTVCDPALTNPSVQYNGTITTTIDNQVGSLDSYDFVLGGGSGVQDVAPNQNRFVQLNGGITYTVTVTHLPTGCVSTPASIQVLNDQQIPALATSADGSTNCVPGVEDGRARVVTVDGAPATTTGFTFAWTGPASFPVTTKPTNTAIELQDVQGGAGYNYTVLVTNQSNGCQNTAVVNVPDSRQLPTMTLTPQPNGICDPAKATLGGNAYDGEVQAAINTIGNYAGSSVGDFEFAWNTGLNGIGENLLANVDVGTYTVTARHVATGCVSDPHNAQVLSAKVLPAITMSSTPSQNCAGGDPDGIASVTNVVPNGRTYDYRWFIGNSTAGTAGPTFLGTTAVTSDFVDVQGGINGTSLFEYTVEVTILETGCVNTATVTVDDDSEVPVLGPLTTADNTLCTVAKNGEATVGTLSYRGALVNPADYSDFTFVWSGGTQGPAETITELAAGTYTLTVTHNDDNCTSNPVLANIDDDLFYPAIDVAAIEQTSCDPTSPNGSLTATVDETAIGGTAGVIAGYTFTWVDDITSASTLSNAISNLRGNQTYTITVVSDETQCSSTQNVFLDENIVTPTVAVTPTDLTICDPPNGSLQATALAGHSYFWYNGSDAPDENFVVANPDDTSGPDYQNLVPGEYTLVVRDDATMCLSQQVITVVGNVAPEIFPVAVNSILPTVCNQADGRLDGGVHLTATPNDITAVDIALDALTTTTPLGLAVNDPVVLTRTTGALPLPLVENKIYYIESIAGNVVTLSETVGGPAINITSNGVGSIGDFNISGYTFEWYAGIPSPTDPGLGSIDYFHNPPVYDGGPLSTTSDLTPVPDGLYTLQVTDPSTGCKAYLPHTLPFLGSHAVLRITKTDSDLCPYTIGNGSIEIQIEDPPAAPPAVDQTSYLVSLRQGINVIVGQFTPPHPVDPFPVSAALAPGTYTVHVQETYSGTNCEIVQDVIINADALPPVVTLAGVDANTACDVTQYDGEIEIEIAKDPDDETGAGVTYDIFMTPDPNGAFPLNTPIGTHTAANLGPGTYEFTVTSSRGCTTTKNFTVLDNPTKAQFNAASIVITDAEYCDPLLEQTASVLINQLNIVGGGAENLADYRFDWYTDATLSTNIYSELGDPTPGKGGELLSNVGAPLPAVPVTNGAYWVVATKIADVSGTGGMGCTTSAFSLNIGSKKVLPQITLTPFGDSSCDPTAFEGSLQVDVTTASGPGAAANYDYVWAPTGAAGQPANSGGNSGIADLYTDLNDGVYQLTATNEVTGCVNTLSTTIQRIAPPVFTVDALATELTHCVTFDGRIDNLQVFVDGVGGNIADFDYVWFRSNLAPGSVVLDGQDAGVLVDTELTPTTYPDIGVDVYFVKAIRTGGGPGVGCESAPLKKEILDGRAYPQVSFATVGSTSCNNEFDGQITVTATTNGFGAATLYDFDWTSNPAGTTITDQVDVVSAPVFMSEALGGPAGERIGPGVYNITVTNKVNMCPTTGTVTLQQNTVPVDVVTTIATALTHCTVPDGSVAVTGVNVNNAPAGLGDFVFDWTGPDGPYAGTNVNDLSNGDYFVTATKTAISSPASGCASTPYKVTVVDDRRYPTISFATIASTSCNDEFDGQITVTATTNGFGAGTLYDFDWTSNPVGTTITDQLNVVSAPVFRSEALGGPVGERIGPGSYDVTVTNRVNMCLTTGTVTLQQNTVPVDVVTTIATALTHCTVPDGSVAVTGVNVNNAPAGLGDFVFDWTGPGGPYLGTTNVNNLSNGDYFVTATKTAISSPASGCASTPYKVRVLDDRRYPTISFATLASTSCDNEFDGQITVTATTNGFGAGTLYDFVWTSNPGGTTITSQTDIVSAPVFRSEVLGGPVGDRVGPGSYSITVTNKANMCPSDGTVTLQQNTVPVQILTASATPQQVCAAPFDGTATVALADVRVGGNTVGGGITFEWFDNGGGSLGMTTSLNNLGIGFYTVQATRDAGVTPASGCVSAPFKVEVEDAREYPVISLSATPNTTCNDDYDAAITLSATTAGIGSASNYSITWTNKPAAPVAITDAPNVPASPTNSYVTPATDNIGVGTYEVTVVNLLTQCSSDGSVTVIQNTPPLQLLAVDKLDQLDCAPADGSITINPANAAHVSLVGNYTFAWARNGAPMAAPVPDNVLTGADAARYTIVGTKVDGIAAGCVTGPLSVEIRNLAEKPAIQLSSTANFACDPALANGELSAIIFEGTNARPASEYAIDWFAGKNVTSGASLGSTDVLSSRVEGDYTIVAVDMQSPNLGCENSATLSVRFDKTTFNISLTSTDQTLCAPAQNGSATVIGIVETLNGVSTPAPNLATYDYLWTDAEGNILAVTPTFTPGVLTIDNLLAGTYHVQVRNAVGCISTETAEVVQDQTSMPSITLDNFANPAVCVLPSTEGNLQVSADNSLNFSDYIFEWFEGPDVTGTLIAPNSPTLDHIAYTDPLQYTVRVTNIATHCQSLETYRFDVDTVRIRALASALGRTHCVVNDGSLFATTLEGAGALYNYEWYAGPTPTGTPIYTTKEVTGVPIGQYTVVAIDPTHDFCDSKPYTIEVTDDRILPPVVAVQRNPLTYCDPARPNGVAYASVNGGVVGYTFDWFQGTVGGAPIYTGPEVKGLTSTTYVVRATDNLTSCEQTATILIENAPVNVPEPTVVVLSHHTHCVIPDGWLAASVNGNTANYLLQWFDGSNVKSVADEIGEYYRDLEDGLYTVTATELESGCVSDPVTTEVLPFQENPEFNIAVVPTHCEQEIGEAAVEMLNDVLVESIEWNINGMSRFGARISELPKGEFTVTVTTSRQCVVSRPFIILPEVLVFNGVSRNNDGRNDIFEIACIQDFPNNNVKIFNRAGTLVYEANGYDNQDVFFDGISNRGINLLGTDLPDGTYFYIIDKRDGSKPRTGYLELLK